MRGLGRAAVLAGLVLAAGAPAVGTVHAQQFFNGSQTTPNGAINGGGGVWNNATTNWTDDPGTTSSAYNPSAGTTTVFGESTTSTPATAGTVTVRPAGVRLTGSVMFTATGDNSIYTIAGGDLRVAAGDTTFNVADVSGGPGPSAIIASRIIGNNGVNVQGPGVLVFTAANTYTGGTFICACATLQLGDATHNASIVGTVKNEGFFDIVNANTAGITRLVNDGGLTTFFGANTAGTMKINNRNFGETAFGLPGGTDTASADNARIVNRSGGVTTFNASSTGGNATIINRFSGETDFWDNSKAGSATIVNRFFGVTTFNNSASAENAAITNRFGGSTFFFGNSTAGNATIINNSSGTFGFFPPVGLGFFDNSSAGNATIINNNHGLIAFGFPFGFDTATAGNANITNNSGASLEFNALTTAGNATITTLSGGAVAFFDGSTGGNAAFITQGTGWVDFSGSIGPGLDGRITAGSIAGSGTYYIGAGNTLIVGSNNRSTEVSGVIADFNPAPPCGCPGAPGPGSLEKVGAGTLLLSGTNTYTGTTLISGGTLRVDGSIASSILTTVAAGGTLGGIGTVGDTLVDGGALAPGNSIGTINVAGNLAFTTAGFYMIEISGANTDLTRVTGTATLGGATVIVSPTGQIVKQYTILNATGGVVGTFNPVVASSLPNLQATLTYDPNNVYLNFALNYGPGLNINQQNVANTLVNFFNSSGSIPGAFAGLTHAGLTQVSGELATGTQQATFDSMNLFLGLITDPFVAGRNGGVIGNAGATPFAEAGTASAYAATSPGDARSAFAKMPTKAAVARNDLLDTRYSVWGSAFGGGSSTDGNAVVGSNTAQARAFGLAAGVDYRISPQTLVGFAMAGGGTNFSVLNAGYGRSDMFQAGVFIRHNQGAAYVTAGATFGRQDVTTDRTVTAAGFEQLHAHFNANSVAARIEGGYRFATGFMGITPYAAGQFISYFLPSYSEQVLAGPGLFALNYAGKDVTASRTELGVRLDKSWAMQTAILTLRGRLAWAHDFNTDRSILPAFQTLPGAAPFTVFGAAQAPNSALVTAAAEMKWMSGWSVAGIFEGQFSDINRTYSGKGVVRYSW